MAARGVSAFHARRGPADDRLARTRRRPGDLILLKLAAGGTLDLRDAAALLTMGERDLVVREVEAHIDDVRPDVRAAWRDLLSTLDR